MTDRSETPVPAGFRIGDRVLIERRSHPWYGHTGVIVRDFAARMTDLAWVVMLDNGQEPAVSEGEITRVG